VSIALFLYYFLVCVVFPAIAAGSSIGDTGLRIEEWWEMFKNVGE